MKTLIHVVFRTWLDWGSRAEDEQVHPLVSKETPQRDRVSEAIQQDETIPLMNHSSYEACSQRRYHMLMIDLAAVFNI